MVAMHREVSKLNSDSKKERKCMKCPFCNTEMLHGYLNCGTAIWSERKHKLSLLPDGKESYALHLKNPMMSPHHIESHCCPKCKKMIIDTADYENNLG